MSWKFLRQKTVKANKEHSCVCCEEVILKGEQYVERIGTHDNNIISMKMHKECEEFTSGWDDEDWETFDRGSINRPVVAQ